MKKTLKRISLDRKVKIKHRTFLTWAVIIVAYWSVLMKPVSSLPGPISYLKYLPDGLLLGILILSMTRRKLTVGRQVLPVLRIVLAFFVICLLVYLLQYQSLAYFLWGFRNIFRFFIAFFVFIAYLDESDVDTWFKVMDTLFWLNIGLSLFQFLVLGVGGDFLGGIFGINGASNGFTICFMSIVVGKSMLETFNGREAIVKSMARCIAAILVAAMAEMKFFFFVMIFLMVFSALMTRFSIRKMVVILLGMTALAIGAMLLVQWFGSNGFFSLEGLWEKATQEYYSDKGDINRLSAISALIKRLDLSPTQQIFGLGLGNCDHSSFAICNTPFYRTYGYLHYTWFTSAMVFLETGFLGLGIYISFYFVCFRHAYKRVKSSKANQLYNQLAVLMAILCVVLTVYNASLRTESGYMMYFVLALPFIRQAPQRKDNSSWESVELPPVAMDSPAITSIADNPDEYKSIYKGAKE